MALIYEYQDIISDLTSNTDYFKHNRALYEVNEGRILPYIVADLKNQLSGNTFKESTFRIPPINLLKKIVDKLSTIYQPGPARSVSQGGQQDQELLDWYNECFKTDVTMNRGNEYFNLFKNTLLHVCLVKGKPYLKAIPSDRYWVYSTDIHDPINPTHVVICNGKIKSQKDPKKTVGYYTIWTDEEFLIVEDTMEVRRDLMELYGNVEGVNPYTKLPFIYTTRSANEIIPIPDSDMLAMSLIIPEGLNDLNAGMMFGVYPIKYGINLTANGMIYAANAMWEFKTDPGQEGKAEIGVLESRCDVDQGLSLIVAQLTLWFQSIGIRPGVIGEINGSNFSSGISKIIDESDTTEHRLKQIGYFQDVEERLWDFVINYAHPYWLEAGLIEDQALAWSPGAEISINFVEPIPLQSRSDLVKDLKLEVDSGFTTKRRAVRKLNPELSEGEIDELMSEIDEEKMITINTFGGLNGTDQSQQDQSQKESPMVGVANDMAKVTSGYSGGA